MAKQKKIPKGITKGKLCAEYRKRHPGHNFEQFLDKTGYLEINKHNWDNGNRLINNERKAGTYKEVIVPSTDTDEIVLDGRASMAGSITKKAIKIHGDINYAEFMKLEGNKHKKIEFKSQVFSYNRKVALGRQGRSSSAKPKAKIFYQLFTVETEDMDSKTKELIKNAIMQTATSLQEKIEIVELMDPKVLEVRNTPQA